LRHPENPPLLVKSPSFPLFFSVSASLAILRFGGFPVKNSRGGDGLYK
jgi:hypothetical protein